MAEITELVVGMAKSNPKWGYTRIRGALSNLGHTVARSTIANIVREHGIEPAPERGERTLWRTFLTAQSVAATDFFTVEVATVRRLVTYYVLSGKLVVEPRLSKWRLRLRASRGVLTKERLSVTAAMVVEHTIIHDQDHAQPVHGNLPVLHSRLGTALGWVRPNDLLQLHELDSIHVNRKPIGEIALRVLHRLCEAGVGGWELHWPLVFRFACGCAYRLAADHGTVFSHVQTVTYTLGLENDPITRRGYLCIGLSGVSAAEGSARPGHALEALDSDALGIDTPCLLELSLRELESSGFVQLVGLERHEHEYE